MAVQLAPPVWGGVQAQLQQQPVVVGVRLSINASEEEDLLICLQQSQERDLPAHCPVSVGGIERPMLQMNEQLCPPAHFLWTPGSQPWQPAQLLAGCWT